LAMIECELWKSRAREISDRLIICLLASPLRKLECVFGFVGAAEV
jgi:hypothetical protein